MTFFCHTMDISDYNAFVMYSEIKPTWNQRKKYKRRIFLEELGKSLGKEEIIRRKRVPQGNSVVNLVKSSTVIISSKEMNVTFAKMVQNIQPNVTNACDFYVRNILQ